MNYTKATLTPHNPDCKGCLFVSVEGGCDVSIVCGRSRMLLFKELGYDGTGGYDCPMRAETMKKYREKIKLHRHGGGLIISWR